MKIPFLFLLTLRLIFTTRADPLDARLMKRKTSSSNGGGGGGNGALKCKGRAMFFERDVLINLVGRPEYLSATEVNVMEQAFLTSYNCLSISTCTTGGVRIANKVTTLTNITDSFPFQRPQNSSMTNFSLRLRIQGFCRGCNPDITLFTNDTKRFPDGNGTKANETGVKAAVSKNNEPMLRRHMNGVSEVQCIECTPPSTFAFTEMYNKSIRSTKTSKNVVAIGKVTEVKAVLCNTDFSEFETNVILQISGYPEYITDAQLSILEETFLETFNDLNSLNSEKCDLSFREVTQISISTDSNLSIRRLQRSNPVAITWETESTASRMIIPRTRKLLSPSILTLSARVHGRCRGCMSNSTLFDDDKKFVRRDLVDRNQRRTLQLSSEDQCFCPINADLGAPTSAIFTAKFERNVKSMNHTEPLHFVDNILEVVELEEVECTSQLSYFESYIVLEFFGDFDNATADQLAVLKQAFLESYNAANVLDTATCDLQFRVVNEVDININGTASRRLLANPSGQNSTSTQFNFRFTMRGTCRGCEMGANLFQNSDRRKLSSPSKNTLPRFLQNVSKDDCLCPVNAEIRVPTIEEFSSIFTSELAVLQKSDTLTFIEGIADEPIEVNPAKCDETIGNFETEIIVPFSGDPDLTSKADLDRLESAFLTSYNDLSQSNFCDPLFRSVLSVNIVGSVSVPSGLSRNLDSRYLQTNVESTPRRFYFKFVVSGQCRGCMKNTKLFNDAVRRRSLVATSNKRRLDDGDQCFCPTEFVDDRAPTEEEFSLLYNETVIALDLPYVDEIFDDIEEPETPYPTVSLSPSPSISASPSPSSIIPTFEFTPIPSSTSTSTSSPTTSPQPSSA